VVCVQKEEIALKRAVYFFGNQNILPTFARFSPGVLFFAPRKAQEIMLNP
jgi:hypothetical protein